MKAKERVFRREKGRKFGFCKGLRVRNLHRMFQIVLNGIQFALYNSSWEVKACNFLHTQSPEIIRIIISI